MEEIKGMDGCTQPQEVKESQSNELVDKIESELVDNPVILELLLSRPQVMSLVGRTAFKGPLPPPAMLKAYKDIDPDAVKWIMERSEREQLHRHKVTENSVDGNIGKGRRGQWMAFSITLLILAIATIFAWKGQVVFAGTLITIDLIGLVSIFALGRIIKSPDETL
ncbi:putative membrane protein [Erwinia toletana]|uniref:Membrane protein n=1 Tax=Winslowiella toletana TaxID=92490 RepID=A0ABS4P5V3_9GAMM|nr:DUF2335 domain-containing protein [Winslowiella toletana]MBP2168014.1 putative membrane protein [Winslowiella toletana]